MVKAALLEKYELVLIVDAGLNNEEKEDILKSTVDILSKAGAKIINSQVWLEKQKFTFDIKKRKEGTYYLVNYEGEGSVNRKAQKELKLNEKILRYAVIRAE